MEETIYSGSFGTLGELQTELENVLAAARAARTARGEGSVHPDEIEFTVGQVFLDEETLTDGSHVFNLRIV